MATTRAAASTVNPVTAVLPVLSAVHKGLCQRTSYHTKLNDINLCIADKFYFMHRRAAEAHESERDEGRCTLYVSGLSSHTRDADVEKRFAAYGKVCFQTGCLQITRAGC